MSEDQTRGILSDSDKDWLRGDIEYQHRQTAADRRRTIRTRVSEALQDFKHLNEHWSSEERRKMMEEFDYPEQSAAEIIEFLYILLNERSTDIDGVFDENAADRALAFRRGLSTGIKQAKHSFGEFPNFVLIDSNTALFELPSKKEIQQNIDTDQWRNANDHLRRAAGGSEDDIIDKEKAARQFHMSLHFNIQTELYRRRGRADSEIKRHDQMIGPHGPSLKRDDSTSER